MHASQVILDILMTLPLENYLIVGSYGETGF